MRIKRFSAKDLPEAVGLIKEEFGLAAIILSQRASPQGGVEVTAGVREEDLPGASGASGAAGPRTGEAAGGALSGASSGASSAAASGPGGPKPRSPRASALKAVPRGERGAAFDAAGSTASGAAPGEDAQPSARAGRAWPSSASGASGASEERTPFEAPDFDAMLRVEREAPSGRARPAAAPAAASRPQPKAPPAFGAAAYRKIQAEAVGEPGWAELKDFVAGQFAELKDLFLDLAHRQSLAEKWRERPELVGLYRRLLGTGLSPERARAWVEQSAESRSADGGELLDRLKAVVRPSVRCLTPEAPWPKLLALTGPSGSGKTTALARLAAHCQKRGLKVSAVTLDTYRLGAAEQLIQYARIMGLGLKVCQNRAELAEALELFQDDDLLLVDTSARHFASGADDLSAALREAGAGRLLTLPAGAKRADLEECFERQAGPGFFAAALTKLDETRGLGDVMDFLADKKPLLAFFSAGPKTPEDFLAARADWLLDLWLEPALGRPGA
ncbi:MAG: ATP/GTP-binding protein [Deltaproteobacteria bacterium]|jgi:flagellar biosynthesis GTPase FlhF|nr:ATP/GTP-binding protein [Deltaproteobacteria bacterium]